MSDKTTLKKNLTLFDVFAIASGAMISSGLFVLPGIVYAKAGPSMVLSYLLAGLIIIPSMLAKAELATAMPKAGGTYFFIERSLGSAAGTFAGFANWFSISLKSAFALIGIGAFAAFIFPELTIHQIKLIAIVACLFFTCLNLMSVKIAGHFQVFLVMTLFVILILYIGRGFISTHPDRYVPFIPQGIGSMFSSIGLVFVSFGGLTKIVSIAEEVKKPGRNIPLGMFLSFFAVTLMYVLAIGVTIGIVNGSELKNAMTPLTLGAIQIMGKTGGIVLSIAAIMAFITTANAGILSASRSPLAMSRDQLLPQLFTRINKRFQTPHCAIFLTSGFMICVIAFLGIENLVKTASTLMIILFMMVNISVIIMRESKIQNYRPKFRTPFYPWLPIGAVVAYCFLLIEMGKIPLLITGGFVLLGLLNYYVYSRVRVRRKSAILHIIRRASAKELKDRTLDKELRELVIERDEIIEDRFDRLIRNCEILDLKGSPSMEAVFHQIAEILAERLDVDHELLFRGFMEREKQSGTVIHPGLAIPHVIIPGTKKFDILLVRYKEGLQFSSSPDLVHTMFVLVGSIDERNYHLRALMAIAQIAQETHFEKKWLEASNTDALRDVVLLSSRKREST
jgi:APA family basic amino acid/polyamine antiporter